MDITFAIEPVSNAWPELIELHRAHWGETEAYRHGQPFAPRLDRYLDYERIGWYVLYTARDEDADRALVGNVGVYYAPSMHTQELIATEDTLFLLKDYRRGGNAKHFIQFVIADAWRRGAVELTVTSKNDKTGSLLKYLDFQPVAVQYSMQRRADSAVVNNAMSGAASDGQVSPVPDEARQ